MTSWHLGDINFQVFQELRPLDLTGRLTVRSQISNRKLRNYPSALPQIFLARSLFTYERDFYSFEFFFIFDIYAIQQWY